MEFNGSIKSKLPNVATTIFTIMSGLAQKHQAINLSQGFPGFDISSELISLVNKHMSLGRNQYAPMAGVMQLRVSLAALQYELYQASYHPETEITITAGATQGIYTALSALVQPGDEVIMFSPAYDCYAPAVEINGGKSVFVELDPSDYSVPWDQVKQAITVGTKVILTNTPHNPTGSVWSLEDLKKLEELVDGTDIIIISDEVYAHIIYDDIVHASAALSHKLRSRSVIVHSFGKTFHATGWKMGYVLAPANLMKEFRKVHQYLVFSVNTPVQYALAEYIENRQNISDLASFYQEKRDYFLNLIEDSRFKYSPASGSYFQLLSYGGITDESDVALAKKWTIEKGIASIPISVFYSTNQDNKVLRFCFAKENEVLEKAAEILCKI